MTQTMTVRVDLEGAANRLIEARAAELAGVHEVITQAGLRHAAEVSKDRVDLKLRTAPDKVTQRELVLHHLLHRGPLSPLEALLRYGIGRLAARVLELRTEGHDVQTVMVKENGKRFGRYQLNAEGPRVY